MTRHPRRVLVTNCVLLNTGDAAILQGLVESLRAALGADIEIVIADSQPEVARRLYPEADIRPLLQASLGRAVNVRGLGRLVRLVRTARIALGAWCMGRGLTALTRLWLSAGQRAAMVAYRDADVVVSTGGTYLVEHYDLAGRFLELTVALHMGKPLILFTQSLGPFERRRNRRVMRMVARRARLVLLRDERSRGHLLDLGVAGDHLHVVGDAAFALLPMPRSPRHGPLRVAVSVRDWPYVEGDGGAVNGVYRDAIAQAVVRLVRGHQARVRFVSTCQGVPEYWTDDSAVAADVVERLPEDVRAEVEVDSSFHSPTELMTLLGGVDLAVATRMHMAILALGAGTAVFPLAYEFKTRELCERLGLGTWVRDLQDVDPQGLPQTVDHFLDALPELHDDVHRRVEAERASARSAAGLISHALRLDPSRRA